MSGAEKWMVGLTGAIAFFGLCTVGVGILQWHVMSGTLTEMQQSGGTSTDQLWQAIGNMNWMARTADGSLREAHEEFIAALKDANDRDEVTRKSTKALVGDSITAQKERDNRAIFELKNTTHTESRPHVDVRQFTLFRPVLLPAPHPITFNAVPYNSGRSTAETVTTVGFHCATGPTAEQLFFGPEIKMPDRDTTAAGVSISAISTGNATQIDCDGTPTSRAIQIGIEIMLYGRFYYTDFGKDWHHSDFCVAGSADQILANTAKKCSHNNTSD